VSAACTCPTTELMVKMEIGSNYPMELTFILKYPKIPMKNKCFVF
jgi:hypothetical protein